jgi:aryl-alcohol dehydrogenase-like predicted oxidoreductase
MEYVKLGRTGLEVSRICLECMSYGVPDRGGHSWTLPEEESRAFVKRALGGGINFFDTENVYSDGTSEENPSVFSSINSANRVEPFCPWA